MGGMNASSILVSAEWADVEVSATFPVRHLCPFVDEVDDGTVTINWACSGSTFELHNLAAYLSDWADSTLTHEAITDRIAHDLATASPGIQLVAVTTTWATAGGSITVTAQIGPTP